MSDRALWITAQGRFGDVRERPLGLKPGIAHLIERAPGCTVLPLAIEYGFWLERGAEAFMAFGEPMRGEDLAALARPARRHRLEDALTATLDRLSADVQSRDPARFKPVLEGRPGSAASMTAGGGSRRCSARAPLRSLARGARLMTVLGFVLLALAALPFALALINLRILRATPPMRRRATSSSRS